MTEQDLIELEEVLLGYLRSSKKINLANIEKYDITPKEDKMIITLYVDKDFGNSLMRPLNHNPFEKIFKEESEK